MIKPYNKAEIEFEIKTEIGHDGKNSRVYIIHDKQLDAELAIKQIEIKDFKNIDLYFNEARILYLSSHKNVVDVKYACKDDNSVYIAMPYYEKGSIKQLMASKFLTVRDILRYALQIITGLHNIHTKKLIHFDIKPDNILISNNNEALIADFGLAKPTNLVGLAGQDRFYFKQKPPEAFDTDHFDNKYDIYQLGITLYRMCNGNTYFNSILGKYINKDLTIKRDDFKFDCQNGRFPDRSYFLPHIPKKLKKVILKCIEIDPDKRYSSVLEVSNELADIDGNFLDWEYSIDAEKKIWSKNLVNKKIVIELDNTSRLNSRKEYDDNRIEKIHKYCQSNFDTKDLLEIFENY
jgi:eukaryotic-like serine/threonine-protein kinase